ncbi:MAG: hypothetical protein HC889_00145 [Synechococcaceae cyanobacterium SM1_2_3]|nr:hypothetical protein [Synechococcaceae cyanobacterium SM1_2_3]
MISDEKGDTQNRQPQHAKLNQQRPLRRQQRGKLLTLFRLQVVVNRIARRQFQTGNQDKEGQKGNQGFYRFVHG